SQDAVERALEGARLRFRRLPWGFALPSKIGTLYVAFETYPAGAPDAPLRGCYARAAFRPELVDAARAVLEPALRHRDAPLVAHVSFENLYGWYGPQLDATLEQAAAPGAAAGDPQTVFATRTARELVGYARSVKSV